MSTTDKNYLEKLFINEAKPALKRHSGGGGEPCPSIVIITGTVPYNEPTIVTDTGYTTTVYSLNTMEHEDAMSYALYEKVEKEFTIEGACLDIWAPDRNKNVTVTLLEERPDEETEWRTYRKYKVACSAFPAILDIATYD